MASFNGLWLPNSDSSNASPSASDMQKVLNSQMVQASRVENLFVPRLIRNNTAMFAANGHVAKDVDFTILGGVGVQTHQANDRFSGMNMNQIQRRVSLDDRPVSNTIEEEIITKQFDQVQTDFNKLAAMGEGHAQWTEVECMKAIADASAYANNANINDSEFLEGGGSIPIGGTVGEAQALSVFAAIDTASIAWGKKGVPTNGRNCLVKPETYWQIAKLEVLASGLTDIAGGIYGNADIVGDKIAFTEYLDGNKPLRYRGVNIWQHNLIDATYNIHVTGLKSAAHIVDTDHNSRGSVYATDADMSNIEGLLFQESCVGIADVMSMMVKQEEVPLSTNMAVTALSWIGLGTLVPEAAYTLTTS